MKLFYTEDNKTHKVYKIRSDSVGYPHFLIFVDNTWLWVTGKNIKPLSWKNKIVCLFSKNNK